MQLADILNYMLLAILIILSLPVLILLVQTILALFANKKRVSTFDYANIKRPSVGVLVPSHNEAGGIATTVQVLVPQLLPDDQLVVIADNCTDNTASIAKEAGALVIERFNDAERGKGYALDYGMQHLSSKPPEVLVVVDADCIVASDFLEKASKACIATARPIQVDYLMEFPGKRTLKQKIVELAWVVKNKVRPTGYKVLGLPCQLMGTGMVFLWEDIVKCNIASGHIVEDMQLGLDLASIRKPPCYLADTYVSSKFPNSQEGMASQRKRWEHGHMSVMLDSLPLLFKAAFTANFKLFMQLLDLMVPPLALLMMLVLSALGLSGLSKYFFNQALIAEYAFVLFCLLSISIFIAWLGYGRKVIKLQELLLAPLVLLMKIPLYVGFIFNRQADWVRSKRD